MGGGGPCGAVVGTVGLEWTIVGPQVYPLVGGKPSKKHAVRFVNSPGSVDWRQGRQEFFLGCFHGFIGVLRLFPIAEFGSPTSLPACYFRSFRS